MTTAPIALFGGSFNPPHWGHWNLAHSAWQHFALQKVIWVPVGMPNHKASNLALGTHRKAMVLALWQDGIEDASNPISPPFELDESELVSNSISYSFNTMALWRKKIDKRVPLLWLMGWDSFASLNTWYRFEELFSFASLVVTLRGENWDMASAVSKLAPVLQKKWRKHITVEGMSAAEIHKKMNDSLQLDQGQLYFWRMPPREVSATQIRLNVSMGFDISVDYETLSPRVANYIQNNQLYRV